MTRHQVAHLLQLACALTCGYFLIVGVPHWFATFAVIDMLLTSLRFAKEASDRAEAAAKEAK